MSSPHIITVTADTFADQVLERSRTTPVLVDFWADWCGPCHMLMPVLAKLAEEFDGGFVLAKVDTDAEQSLAMQFGVRSLPTVKLVRDGEVVDEFMGALPEGQVRRFLEPYLERASDQGLAEAQRQAAAGALPQALAAAAEAHAQDPDNARVTCGYAELLITAGDLEQAEALLKALPPADQESDDAKRLLATIGFARMAAAAKPLEELDHVLQRDPADSAARCQAAAHEVLKGNYAQAMEHLFSVIASDHSNESARQGLLGVFQIAGDDASVSSYRRRMFTLLH